MSGESNNILAATMIGVTEIIANATCNLLLYLGMYKYVTELSWTTSTEESINSDISDSDMQYLISMLLHAMHSGDPDAIAQFNIDFNRLGSITTDSMSCTLSSPPEQKKQVLEKFLAATNTLPLKNAQAVVSQLNQSVGNHALCVVVKHLMQQGSFRHAILQSKMKADLYSIDGRIFGIRYVIPMYPVEDDNEDKIPDKEITAHLELKVEEDGSLNATHDIRLIDTTRVESRISFLHLFRRSTENPQETQCHVKIEDVTDADCAGWTSLVLI